jgi:predicted Zn-dependent peptidase
MSRPALLVPAAFAFALTAACVPLAAQSVACEKYRLRNGLTVILHVDHKVPRVVVNTWFRVGAKDEPPRRSGFAHLFEHLMFMGTDRVPGNQFDVIMEGSGGANNASTTEDRTNYFSMGPSSMLPTLLWLDADRLEDVGRTMDQQKLDRQREIVHNEMRQMEDNAPYGRTQREVFRLMFPPGHPYRDTTFGTHADLDAASVDDVRDFFANFYVPCNASLVIAGDFDPAAVKPLVERLYGTLPAAPPPPRRVVQQPRLERVERATILDRVHMPLVRMCWHAPANATPGTAELELLGEVLSSGNDSRLYRRLVEKEKIATEVSAYLDGLSLGSLFGIEVYGVPGADLDRIEALVDEELERVRKDGVDAAELDRRKTGREVAQVASLQDLGRVADQLNRYEFLWGEPDSFARDLQRFRAVTPDAVRDAARNVLDPQRRAIVRVLPTEGERAKSARDERPPDFESRAFEPAPPTELQLGNGMRVLHWHRPGLPLVATRLLVCAPAPLVEPPTCGVTALVADMMVEGVADLDAAQFAAALETLGASFRPWVDHESANASLSVLARNWPRALHLMFEAVARPRLQEAAFERCKRVRLSNLRAAEEQPGSVAGVVASRVFFGAQDPYGWPVGGTVDTVEKVTLAQVAQCHRSLFAPGRAVLLVAGDVTADAAQKALEQEFGTWAANADMQSPPPPRGLREQAPLRVVVVDRPSAPQTAIVLMLPAPTYGDPARMRLEVLSQVLGGTFTSRLNMNLREQHGYTYGAGSSFALGPWAGWFNARTNVQTQVTGPALKELLAELARLRGSSGGDVTAAEVTKIQRTVQAQVAQSFESLGGVIGSVIEPILNGLPLDQLARDLKTLATIDAAAINAASRADLDLDHGVLVLVGDRKTILEQIAGLGLPAPEERDARGRPIAR